MNRQTAVTVYPDAGNPSGLTTTTQYDNAGNVKTTTDPLGHSTTYDYDPLNRLVQAHDALCRTTVYSYDTAGNRKTLTDPAGNTTSWDYDELNRIERETNQLGGSRQFQYDAVGNLEFYTDRNGRVVKYLYDQADRRTGEQWLDAGGNVLRTITTAYDPASRVTSVSDPAATVSYNNFDGAGRAQTVSNNIALLGQAATLTQSFDAAGNRSSLTVAVGATSGFTNNYNYDALNRVDDIKQIGSGVSPKFVDYVFDAAGRLTNLDRYAGTSTAGSVVAKAIYSHDDANRLTHLTYNDPVDAALADYDWQYDAASRVTLFVSNDGTASYNYDNTNQLTGETYSGTSVPADQSYSFDANGNRNSTGYVTAANNRTTSDGTYNYEYDAEGNRIRRIENATGATTEYEWDHRNRLVTIRELDSVGGGVMKTVQYAYDPLNRRVAKTIDADGSGPEPAASTLFIHDGDRAARDGAGDQIALVLEGSGNITNRFLYGSAVDQLLADEQFLDTTNPSTATDLLWPLADHQGSVRDVARHDGAAGTTAVVNHIVYNAFGYITSETDTTIQLIAGYTGRERDYETPELNYYRARYYATTLGQFISEDPKGFAAGDTHLGRYVGNHPTYATDPSGLEEGFMPWLSETINGAVDDAWDATGGRLGRWLWKKSWENPKTIKQMEQERDARMAAQYARLVQPPTSNPNESSVVALGKGAGFGARQGRVAFVNSLLLGRQPAYRAAAEKFAQDAVERNDAVTTIGLAAGDGSGKLAHVIVIVETAGLGIEAAAPHVAANGFMVTTGSALSSPAVSGTAAAMFGDIAYHEGQAAYYAYQNGNGYEAVTFGGDAFASGSMATGFALDAGMSINGMAQSIVEGTPVVTNAELLAQAQLGSTPVAAEFDSIVARMGTAATRATGSHVEVRSIYTNMATRQGTLQVQIRGNQPIGSMEINAAQVMTHRGYDVVLRTPVGTRASGGTSDLLLDGVRADIFAPTTTSSNRVVGALLKKNSQLPGGGTVVLDLRNTTLTANDFANAGARLSGAANKSGVRLNIRRIEIIE